MHEVMTATRAHRNAPPEYKPVELDSIQIQNRKGQTETVKGAEILMVGVGAAENTVRLALAGGRHVDVDRAFFNRQQAGRGKFYIQHADGTPEVIETRAMAEHAIPVEGTIRDNFLPSAADLDAAAAEQKAKEEAEAAAKAAAEQAAKDATGAASEATEEISGDAAQDAS